MNSVLKARSDQFASEVRGGRPLQDTIEELSEHVHHDAVIEAALEMLGREGNIDMKRLATAAGMSRASLYRYYPDRGELIAEVAGIGFEGLVSYVNGVSGAAQRIEAVGDYMLAHTAETIAMLEMASSASADALDAAAELVFGDSDSAPWLVGIASMCATPSPTERDIAAVRRHVANKAKSVQ